MPLTKRRLLAALAAAALAMPARQVMAEMRLSVVATTGMIADAARAIGGDLVEVRALMGPGVDPHGYRQTRSDIVAMANADLVLWNGLSLEAQMEEFLNGLAKGNAVVAVTADIPQDQLLAFEGHAGRFDPHLWMDPRLWAQAVGAVRDALIAVHPEGAASFTDNAAAYLASIEALAGYTTEVLSTVPDSGRVVLSSHDAFNYFGRAHGFEVLGIQGISTESEAGLQRISELVDMLVARNIGAIFVETSVSDRNIRALIEGAESRGHTVVIGGQLYSDAMGEPGSYEGTYIGMIDHNATTIARALGGQAPATGMQGLLP